MDFEAKRQMAVEPETLQEKSASATGNTAATRMGKQQGITQKYPVS